jgi:hypothetical protein
MKIELEHFEVGTVLNVGHLITANGDDVIGNYIFHKCVVLFQCLDSNEYFVYDIEDTSIRTINICRDKIFVVSIPAKISTDATETVIQPKRINFLERRDLSEITSIPYDDIKLDDIIVNPTFTNIYLATTKNYLPVKYPEAETTEIMIDLENRFIKDCLLNNNSDKIGLSLSPTRYIPEEDLHEDYDWQTVFAEKEARLYLLKYVLNQLVKE